MPKTRADPPQHGEQTSTHRQGQGTRTRSANTFVFFLVRHVVLVWSCNAVWVVNDRNERDTCISEGKGSVIRSLGEDVRVVLGERRRMVVTSRRKRMVAHNIIGTPVLLAVMVRRRPFFQEDPLIMFLRLELYVMPPHKVEVWQL